MRQCTDNWSQHVHVHVKAHREVKADCLCNTTYDAASPVDYLPRASEGDSTGDVALVKTPVQPYQQPCTITSEHALRVLFDILKGWYAGWPHPTRKVDENQEMNGLQDIMPGSAQQQ